MYILRFVPATEAAQKFAQLFEDNDADIDNLEKILTQYGYQKNAETEKEILSPVVEVNDTSHSRVDSVPLQNIKDGSPLIIGFEDNESTTPKYACVFFFAVYTLTASSKMIVLVWKTSNSQKQQWLYLLGQTTPLNMVHEWEFRIRNVTGSNCLMYSTDGQVHFCNTDVLWYNHPWCNICWLDKIDSHSCIVASPAQPELKSARLMARSRKVLTPESMPDSCSAEKVGVEVSGLWYWFVSQKPVQGWLQWLGFITIWSVGGALSRHSAPNFSFSNKSKCFLFQSQIVCQNTGLVTPQMSTRGDMIQYENESPILQTPPECVRHR